MSHSLVEIPQDQWPELRDLYEGQKKLSCAYNTLQCLIDWKAQNEALDIKIYSLDGEWRSDGTYVAVKKKPTNYVFLNTLNENQELLLTALKLVNIKEPLLIFGYPGRLMNTVEEFFVGEDFSKETFLADGTFWYYIDKEKAKQLPVNVPEGYTLRSLETKHAEQVNSIWPHRRNDSVHFVELLIAYNDSVGVFDGAGNLVAWSLRLPIGSLGLVHVVDTHKRLGLGSLVVSHMSKLIASKGLEVTAPVVFENKPSRSMFEKLGFQTIDKVYWSVIPERK
ncbi:uncharacterized protein LOC129249154 [Anastrepha obliqua]|uniref:uncharacterized protein LOC129249154 n=1 Tax=Anastrepha obliqua TaxID=95512 RepID=UPI002409C11A|nr:uncharacterized protein LOC129249154 [Anastrepha obliqua]